jgi:hypothetical protein
MSASLISRFGSSTFRPSAAAVSMSLRARASLRNRHHGQGVCSETDAIIFCWCLSDPHLRGLATRFSRGIGADQPRARPADDGLALGRRRLGKGKLHPENYCLFVDLPVQRDTVAAESRHSPVARRKESLGTARQQKMRSRCSPHAGLPTTSPRLWRETRRRLFVCLFGAAGAVRAAFITTRTTSRGSICFPQRL